MPAHQDPPGVPECRAFLHRHTRLITQVAATLKSEKQLLPHKYVLVLFNPEVQACRRLAAKAGAVGSPPVHIAAWPSERRLLAELYAGDMRPFGDPVSRGHVRVLVVGSKHGRLIWDHGFALTAADLSLEPWPRRPGSSLDHICGALFDEVPTSLQAFGDEGDRFWSMLTEHAEDGLLQGLTLEQSVGALPGAHPILFVLTSAVSDRERDGREVLAWMEALGPFDYEYRPCFTLAPRFAEHMERCEQLLGDRLAWAPNLSPLRRELFCNVRRSERLVWLIHGLMPLPDPGSS